MFAIEDQGRRLYLLDSEDLTEQSEEICQTLSALESELLIASKRTGLDSRALSVERCLIKHLDEIWGELT